ncbi:rna-directed dna polymerase from mobile element jockey [Lasius niger]|uniref:Rna-directed dna polymerase from mobile element jockey n=1 Tax=Lasius niger TaxID=67767 RepID=A0A0J7KKQ7_LASNI|nr:rna-directed dna polymerase from mobile element jockey [Lasius niger]
MDLKIMTWNAKDWKNKKEELCKRVHDYDINIITETKNRDKDRFCISGYITITKNRRSGLITGAGGVAMLIKKGIKFEEIKNIQVNSNNIEALGVRIKGLDRAINLIGIYRKPGETEQPGVWKRLVESSGDIESLILTGDFNAHNRVWNCEQTDKNGEILMEELEEKNMFVVNSDTLTRIGEGGTRPSNLDLIFSSDRLFSLMKHKQGDDTWGSDHFPVSCEINVKKCPYRKLTNRISRKKTIGGTMK